ncbi:DUF4097 family beta strand repeat-containing protein [Luteimonas abyssi]|uniref:DUF4097 family beta strand repeat-containing protein n=1 Tax=Luteimonas abyssi TaxID=1247514 RepID=UPI000737D6FD|nr:DUF4097 family beta strand repeat-containing protein [Luteimonas abyssi]
MPALGWAQSRVDERHPLASGGRIEVENVAGSVRVRGWDRDEVAITGSLGRDLELEVDASRNRIHVKVAQPRSGRGAPAEIELRVPKGAELQVTTVSASIEMADADLRRLQARSVSGRLDASGRAQEASLSTVSGAIESRLTTGRLSVDTVSGRVRAGGGITGEIEAKTVSGSIALELERVERLRAETVSGSLEVGARALAPGGRVAMESVSGRAALTLPANASARLDIQSFSGGIQSDAGEVERPRYGPGRSVRTQLGSGNGDVSIKSHSGSVRLSLGR